MKERIVFTVVSLIFTLSSFALGKDSLHAVTLVSYDQELSDYEASLTLKNNTNQMIHNVCYRITYLDMKGNVIDYNDFTSKVEIEPGLARIVKVKAFQEGNGYSYYTSEYSNLASHRFKIKFELRGYNEKREILSKDQKISADDDTDDNLDFSLSDGFSGLLVVFSILLILGIYIGLYVLVAVMAQKRNRSIVGWLLLSLFLSPFIVIIILLFIGKGRHHDFVQ